RILAPAAPGRVSFSRRVSAVWAGTDGGRAPDRAGTSARVPGLRRQQRIDCAVAPGARLPASGGLSESRAFGINRSDDGGRARTGIGASRAHRVASREGIAFDPGPATLASAKLVAQYPMRPNK